MLVKEILPDKSVVTVSRLWTEHRDASGTLLAAREPNVDELAELDAREAAQVGLDVWGPVEQAERDADRALDSHRAEIRAARLRLQQIVTQGQAAADAASGVTKVHLQATVDLAAIVLELGRVVLRDAS